MTYKSIHTKYLWYLLFSLTAVCPAATDRIIYVDDDGPADFNTIQAAIDDCNDGDTVLVAPGTYTGDGNRDIDFKGKAITVISEEGPQTCIIDCNGTVDEYHRGFYFHNGEDANSVLQGFTISSGYTVKCPMYTGGGIYCDKSSPRIENCIVTANKARHGGGIACIDSHAVIANCIICNNIASINPIYWSAIDYSGSGGGIYFYSYKNEKPILINCIVAGNGASYNGGGISCDRGNTIISNCTIYGNRTGDWGRGGGITSGTAGAGYTYTEVIVHNCIIWGNTARYYAQIGSEYAAILGPAYLNIVYCSVQSDPNSFFPKDIIKGHWISEEPYFVNQGYWDPNGTPYYAYDDFWVDGDYHLKSQAGRWDPNTQSWVIDDVTSPCIDAGDPNSHIGLEPFPNGGIINMGAYGGTTEASKSYFGEPLCETIITGDINGDCKVDLKDFMLLAAHWLEQR